MKFPKMVAGGGAILLGGLIAATVALNLPNQLHYVWAILALSWGILILMGK